MTITDIKLFFVKGLYHKCRQYGLRFSIFAVMVILSGCTTVQQQAQNGVAVAHPPVLVVSSLIPQVQARVLKASVAPIVYPTNTICGGGIVGFTTWNGHIVPYVQNTGTGNIHANQSIAYGQFIITDVEDVYYSKRVAVFDNEDPNDIGHNYTYTLWGSLDLNSHCWIQLDCRQSWGPRIELFDTGKQAQFYRVTRE